MAKDKTVADEFLALHLFRRRAFRLIKRALELDGHHKSYEGTVELRFPSYFEEEAQSGSGAERPEYTITLNCYVLGPGRHHQWSGRTIQEAVDKANESLNKWERELD